ncbi:phosphatidylserine decarboxylase proenzyme [Bacteroides sp. CAG:530]|jgi:phosphatidylserine decarboxylase|nr:phosphatidylserine decarboxylase proenzyme [Bacteroides sp. CAG:530]
MTQMTKIKKIKKIKKIRLHREGTHILITGAILLLLINLALYWGIECKIPFYVMAGISVIVYALMLNFFQCPIRLFEGNTEGVVVAPADGKVVVIEEVDEHEVFHDKRLMISIFMSITNVHANWYPVDGTVRHVAHHNGRFMKAWLPKASTENERSTVVIDTPQGHTIMARQIAGAVARRIVTYAEPNEDCFIDEHMGFIKFGSRVDVYLPLGTEVCVKMGQKTTGNQTIIAKLK